MSEIQPGLVNTEFSTVRFRGDKDAADKVYHGLQPLVASDLAEEIAWIASRPAHVNIAETLVFPVRSRASDLTPAGLTSSGKGRTPSERVNCKSSRRESAQRFVCVSRTSSCFHSLSQQLLPSSLEALDRRSVSLLLVAFSTAQQAQNRRTKRATMPRA